MVSRPFEALIGQAQAVELLQQAVAKQRIAPAYLFVGPPGVGRRLAALEFLQLLLQMTNKTGNKTDETLLRQKIRDRNHPDLLWVEPTYLHQGRRVGAAEAAELGLKRKAPPQVRLDQVRDISQFLSRPPLAAERSVVVIEQAETMGEAAANALLKTLEEPGRATLILIAPDADALLTTLVSRCQRIPFSRLSAAEVATVLQRVGYGDILQHPNLLAIAQGSPGLAIASWQQLQIIPADLLSDLQTPPTSLQQALELGRRIDQTLDTETQLWLIEYLQQTYWQQHQSVPHAVAYLQAFEQARRCLLQYVQPRLVWEVTLMTVQQQMAPWR